MHSKALRRPFGMVGIAAAMAFVLMLPGAAGAATGSDEGEPAESEGAAAQMQVDPQAAPERSSFGGFRIYGDVLLNVQSVSVDGNENRFKKDFGLNDGVYLGTSKLTFVPDGDEPAGWFDTLELYGDGIGFDGDKKNRYRQWGLTAKKADKYQFSVRSRAHNYFWVWDGSPGEFDLDRAFTDFDLSVKATSNLTVTARYRRWTTSGDQLTSFNYSGRGQFPTTVDQRGNAFGVGVQWRLGATTLFLNQDFRNFESDYVLRDGEDDALAALAQSENRDMSAPVSSVGFRTRLADNKVQVEGDFLYSKQSLDSNYGRTWETSSGGTDNTNSVGEAERKLVHGNARVFWRPTDQLAFSARYRRRGWEQRGFRNLIDDGRSNLGGLDYDITLDQFLFGAEFAPVRALSVFGEFGTGSREQVFADLDGDGDPIDDTKFNAYKFGTRIRAGRIFDVEASYSRNDIDNPFARVAASDIEGYKVKARLRPNWHWVVSGVYSRSESESDPLLALDGSTNLATSKFQNLGINVAYMGGPGRSIYAGYAYLDNEINTPIIIWNPVPRFELDTTALYDGQNGVFTFGGEYLLSESFPLTVYGNANYVDSDTTEIRAPELIWTSVDFPVVYYDIRAGARYVLPMGLLLDVQGRWMQYEDTSELFATNTYDAKMFVVGVGYRF